MPLIPTQVDHMLVLAVVARQCHLQAHAQAIRHVGRGAGGWGGLQVKTQVPPGQSCVTLNSTTAGVRHKPNTSHYTLTPKPYGVRPLCASPLPSAHHQQGHP